MSFFFANYRERDEPLEMLPKEYERSPKIQPSFEISQNLNRGSRLPYDAAEATPEDISQLPGSRYAEVERTLSIPQPYLMTNQERSTGEINAGSSVRQIQKQRS